MNKLFYVLLIVFLTLVTACGGETKPSFIPDANETGETGLTGSTGEEDTVVDDTGIDTTDAGVTDSGTTTDTDDTIYTTMWKCLICD